MKVLSTTLFIVLVGLICLTQTTLSQCLEYVKPAYRYKTRFVECAMVSTKDKRQDVTPGKKAPPAPAPPQAPAPAPQPQPQPAPPAPAPGSPASPSVPPPAPNDKFIINFDCPIADKTLCNKVQNTFIRAGNYITDALNLKTPIVVAAKFYDFCATDGECGANGKIILGAATPTNLQPHQDPQDNKQRLYPQALYKQLDLPDHLQYGPTDIEAVFNSNLEYFFVGDPEPMLPTQVDILYVVLHELVHGLGFVSSWNDYANIQALTPLFGPSFTDPTKGQFVELIFDKYFILIPSGEKLTSKADELSQFQFTVDMTDNQLIQSFMASPQFQIAKGLYGKAVTQGTMGFLLAPDLPPNTQLTPEQIQKDVVTLETSFNPFAQGSSISHVDELTYLNSSDFLMMAAYPKSKSLSDMMTNADSTNTTGPIGPQLRRVLGLLGYEIKNSASDSPSPPSATDATDSSSNSSNSGSASASNPELKYKTAFIVSTVLAGIFASILFSLCTLFLIKKYSNGGKQRATGSNLSSGNNSITQNDSSRAIQMPKETLNPNRGREANDSMISKNYIANYYKHGRGTSNNSPSNNYRSNQEVISNLPTSYDNTNYDPRLVVNNSNNSTENLTDYDSRLDVNSNNADDLASYDSRQEVIVNIQQPRSEEMNDINNQYNNHQYNNNQYNDNQYNDKEKHFI